MNKKKKQALKQQEAENKFYNQNMKFTAKIMDFNV